MNIKTAGSLLLAIATSACLRVAPPETPNQRAVRQEMERRDQRHPQRGGQFGEPSRAIKR
jgi:hypothetical protein